MEDIKMIHFSGNFPIFEKTAIILLGNVDANEIVWTIHFVGIQLNYFMVHKRKHSTDFWSEVHIKIG